MGISFDTEGYWMKASILPAMVENKVYFNNWPSGVRLLSEQMPSSFHTPETAWILLQIHHRQEEERLMVASMSDGKYSTCWIFLWITHQFIIEQYWQCEVVWYATDANRSNKLYCLPEESRTPILQRIIHFSNFRAILATYQTPTPTPHIYGCTNYIYSKSFLI